MSHAASTHMSLPLPDQPGGCHASRESVLTCSFSISSASEMSTGIYAKTCAEASLCASNQDQDIAEVRSTEMRVELAGCSTSFATSGSLPSTREVSPGTSSSASSSLCVSLAGAWGTILLGQPDGRAAALVLEDKLDKLPLSVLLGCPVIRPVALSDLVAVGEILSSVSEAAGLDKRLEVGTQE